MYFKNIKNIGSKTRLFYVYIYYTLSICTQEYGGFSFLNNKKQIFFFIRNA